MNMVGFTAEASLYKTSGHYQTGRSRHAVNLSAHMISTIFPAREIIEVHDCAPGGILWEDGADRGCTYYGPSGGGEGEGAGTPTGGGGGGGGGKRPPKAPPKKPPVDPDKPVSFGCSINQLNSQAFKRCADKGGGHYIKCTGARKGKVAHPNIACCEDYGDGGKKKITFCDDAELAG